MVFGTGASSSKRKSISNPGGRQQFSALIVDDDAVIRKIHGALLNRFGFEVQAAKNGREAVELYNSGACFDLVLMDMEMPVMDGPEATRALRAMGVCSMITGVTTRNQEMERQAFMAAGLDCCHEKPLKASTVNSLLQELMNKNS